jgi:hypothetical protein
VFDEDRIHAAFNSQLSTLNSQLSTLTTKARRTTKHTKTILYKTFFAIFVLRRAFVASSSW